MEYPDGFFSGALGEYHIKKRVTGRLWDDWETVEIIKQCEPYEKECMNFTVAVDALSRHLKSPWG